MKKMVSLSLIVVSFLVVFTSCSETEYITEQADNLSPSCVIVTPVPDTVIEKGQSLDITAEADDSDGYITEVRFYIQGDLTASDKDSPYSFGFETAGLTTGSYQIRTEALDNDGGRTSDSLEVFVNSFPECSIFYPSHDSYFFTGTEIEIKATAYDEESSKHVSTVTFSIDGTVIAQDAIYPYSAVWTMTQGSHLITAEVTDDTGSVLTDSIEVHQNYVVHFEDPMFEQVIRRDFLRPEGDLYASYFGDVTDYSVFNEDITDISGIESFRSLEILMLNSNQITDITPLKDLKNIYILSLNSNLISDISALSGLTMLIELQLSNNNITDITKLSGLTKLQVLILSQNDITGLEVLKEFKDLYYLQLAYCGLDDISDLSPLTGLTYLSLQFNSITDISPLSSLGKLTELAIFNNSIEDITALSGMTSLQSLYMRYNQISDISPLKYLKKIDLLFMENNRITDIYPLLLNDGLDFGDMVALNNNTLDSLSVNLYIPFLTDRGVSVSW